MTGPDEPTSLQPLPDPARDEVASLLVDVLNTEAARIEPTDRLAQIRAAGPSRRSSWAPVAAAVAAVLAVGGGTWALVDHDSGRARPATAASSSPTSPVSATPTSSASPSPTAVGPSVTLPVYYPSSRVKGLFREFVRTQATDGQLGLVQRAVQLAVDPSAPTKSGDVSRWLPATAASVTVDVTGDELMVVQVPAAEGQARGRSAEDARLAAQQLVWTATAALQDPRLRVTIQIGTDRAHRSRLFGSLPTDQPFSRPPSSKSYVDLAAIWILQPEPGGVVRGPVVVTGQACTVEANVAWQLLRGPVVVQSGQTTAKQGCPVRTTWTVTLKSVPAGSYTFRAYELSAKDGTSYAGLDTTTFTVP